MNQTLRVPCGVIESATLRWVWLLTIYELTTIILCTTIALIAKLCACRWHVYCDRLICILLCIDLGREMFFIISWKVMTNNQEWALKLLLDWRIPGLGIREGVEVDRMPLVAAGTPWASRKQRLQLRLETTAQWSPKRWWGQSLKRRYLRHVERQNELEKRRNNLY